MQGAGLFWFTLRGNWLHKAAVSQARQIKTLQIFPVSHTLLCQLLACSVYCNILCCGKLSTPVKMRLKLEVKRVGQSHHHFYDAVMEMTDLW